MGYVGGKLPDYMIPSLWVSLNQIPLTSNGKVDRNSLPAVDVSDQLSEGHQAPESALEIQLSQVWQDLLDVDRFGLNDDLFELGGHSLQIIQLISIIRQQFQTEISIRLLLQNTTIKLMSNYLSKIDAL